MRLVALLLLMTLLMGLNKQAHADGVDDYLKAQMAARHIPGLSVAVVQDGKIVKAQGYGLANMEQSVPATAETIYPIGSLSKQFTAVGVMLLVQSGKIKLDAPLSVYLAAMPKSWQTITVRELLNQTSGIPEWNPDPEKYFLLKAYSLPEIARHAAEQPLAFKPGTQFEYSNTNFNLLAGIIAKVTGKPYTDFLQDRLFQPLGMNATGEYNAQKTVANRSAGYDRIAGGVYNNVFFYNTSLFVGAGGLQSTVGDLAKWDAALTSGKVLPLAVMEKMWTPPNLPGGAKTDYGMGWMSDTINGHPLIWHNGAVTGSMGFAGRFPNDHLTVIILSNMFPMDGMDDVGSIPFLPLGQGVAAVYVPALAPAHAAGIPDTDPKTAALLKTVSAQIASGTLDKSLFAPALAAQLTPAAVNPAHDLLAPLGPMTSLILLFRAPNGHALYQASYGSVIVKWIIGVDESHKITILIPSSQ